MKQLPNFDNWKIVLALIFVMIVGSTSIPTKGICAATKVSIEPIASVTLDKEDIYLGSIAKIRGQDRRLVQRLHGIYIGKSPLPGESRRFDSKYILLRIRQGKIDPSRIDIQTDGIVTVKRSSIRASKVDIEKAIRAFIVKKMPWSKGQAKIEKIQFKQDLALPPGKVSLKIRPPKQTDYLGHVPLAVSIYVDGQYQKKIWVSAHIQVNGETVVARKPLGRYQTIARDDLLVKKMDLSRIPSDAIRNIDDAVGKRTTRTILSKSVLRKAMIESPPILKRGDMVTIIAETKGLKVTTQGVTKQKGRQGEMIRVLNIASKKMIYARVLDAGTVQVDF
jgi:flagella basal body P-ring formation protein FlgA